MLFKKVILLFKYSCLHVCVCILTCLNFSHLQSTLHLRQYTYPHIFPTAQNSFWTHWFWCLLLVLPVFVSPLPHWQNDSLWGLFPGQDGWIGRVRHSSHAIFGQKLLNTSKMWAGVLVNHPLWDGKTRWVFKKFTEAEFSLLQQCQLVHWYRWVPRTLT